MRLISSVLAAMVGLSSLVTPAAGLSAADAGQLYTLMMRQPYEERVETLRHLDAPSKTMVMVSRINDYRETYPLNGEQDEFLDGVIEHAKEHDRLSPQIWAQAEELFDFKQFKTLASSVRDIDNTSASDALEDGESEKRSPDCNCATNEGDCGSGRVCIRWTQRSCSVKLSECTWWNLHCDGKCYTR